MVAEVTYTAGFVQQLDNLTKILYKQGYHSFLENAIQYTLRMYDYTDANIQIAAVHKISPNKLKALGTHYITYTPNNRTTWYILFF